MHAIFGALTFVLSTAAPPPGEEDMSPYFLVKGDSSVDRLPLEATSATIELSGVIAQVRLRQVYTNEGSRPLEAVYVFPMSTRAAVFGMQMTIGDRKIRAEIRERKQARADYEKAKDQGQTASLLEAQRPNVFQMNVSNVLPGDRIEVEVDYVEALSPTAGEYELVLPTVVGPRYTGGSPEPASGDRSLAPPRLEGGIAPTHHLSITAHLSMGVPITRLESPSHRVVTTMAPRGDASHADVLLDEPGGANRDFVLRYRLAGDAPRSGVLLNSGAKEQFFLAMLQPPARVEPTAVPPRELIFIIDVSGSMGGFPLDTAKAFIEASLRGLRPADRFNLMFFSGGDTRLADESIPATHENLQRARRMLRAQEGGGVTEIRSALQKALRMPRSPDVSTSFVVVTDGYVTVEKETFALVRKSLGTANLFSFGIGRSVNRHLIEGLARTGMGEPFVVRSEAEATEAAAKLVRLLESPVLTRVKVDFDGFDAHDVVPESIPDLFVDRPVLVFGKFRGPAQGHIRIEGRNGAGRYSAAIGVESALGPKDAHQALRYLWARHAIQALEDEASIDPSHGNDAEILALGLRYGLSTAHTSFVAIDSARRNTDAAPELVEQPLPMPEGLSPNSVGMHGLGSGGGGMGYGRSGAVYGAGGLGLRGGGAGVVKQNARAPAVRQAHPTITGSLDRSVITRVIQPALERIRRAYEKARKGGRDLHGKVLVQFTIEADGRVSKVEIKESTLGDHALEEEIRTAFAQLVFPKAHGLVVVNYPLNLRAQN